MTVLQTFTCPNCTARNSLVRDSRPSGHPLLGSVRYRRRECLSCNYRYTTTEAIANNLNEQLSGHDQNAQAIHTLRKLLDRVR